MRHRAPRNLLALLRLPRWRPRRRALRLPARPGVRLLAAVATALALLTGGLVAASELDRDTVPTSDAQSATERAGAADEASRSDGRTPWPTLTGTPPEPTPSALGPDASPPASGNASPTAQPEAVRSPSDPSLLQTPLGLPTPEVSATSAPTPEVTGQVVPEPARAEPSREEETAPARASRAPRPSPSPTREDVTPPQTTIVSGPTLADDTGKGQDSEFVFSSEESASFACSLDGQAFSPCESPQEYDELTPGRHEFAVRAIDAAGNVDPTPDRQSWITTGLGGHTDSATDSATGSAADLVG